MHIRIYLEINADPSGFLSINKSSYIQINFRFYLENIIVFLTGNTITKSTQIYILGNFSNIRIYPEVCPDLSESIQITIHWIDIQFYSEVTGSPVLSRSLSDFFFTL